MTLIPKCPGVEGSVKNRGWSQPTPSTFPMGGNRRYRITWGWFPLRKISIGSDRTGLFSIFAIILSAPPYKKSWKCFNSFIICARVQFSSDPVWSHACLFSWAKIGLYEPGLNSTDPGNNPRENPRLSVKRWVTDTSREWKSNMKSKCSDDYGTESQRKLYSLNVWSVSRMRIGLNSSRRSLLNIST